MTNRDKIIARLADAGMRCDDCLSKDAGVKPRQQVNQICRELENAGALTRAERTCPPCGSFKIVNRLRVGLPSHE